MNFNDLYFDCKSILEEYENEMDELKNAPHYIRKSLEVTAYKKLITNLKEVSNGTENA